MKQQVLKTFSFNLTYAKGLLADIPQEKMCEQPAGLTNHPAWITGHMAHSLDYFGQLIGLAPACPADADKLFGNGSTPSPDASLYPDKQVLLQALEAAHARVAQAYTEATESQLAQTTPNDTLRPLFPTLGDLLLFGLTGHEATHLGQLSAWRRAQGLASVF